MPFFLKFVPRMLCRICHSKHSSSFLLARVWEFGRNGGWGKGFLSGGGFKGGKRQYLPPPPQQAIEKNTMWPIGVPTGKNKQFGFVDWFLPGTLKRGNGKGWAVCPCVCQYRVSPSGRSGNRIVTQMWQPCRSRLSNCARQSLASTLPAPRDSTTSHCAPDHLQRPDVSRESRCLQKFIHQKILHISLRIGWANLLVVCFQDPDSNPTPNVC